MSGNILPRNPWDPPIPTPEGVLVKIAIAAVAGAIGLIAGAILGSDKTSNDNASDK